MSKTGNSQMRLRSTGPTLSRATSTAYNQLLARSVEEDLAKRKLTRLKPVGKPPGKLTDEQVIEMRRLRESDPYAWSHQVLAERFGVAKSYVNNICNYRARVKGADGTYSLC